MLMYRAAWALLIEDPRSDFFAANVTYPFAADSHRTILLLCSLRATCNELRASVLLCVREFLFMLGLLHRDAPLPAPRQALSLVQVTIAPAAPSPAPIAPPNALTPAPQPPSPPALRSRSHPRPHARHSPPQTELHLMRYIQLHASSEHRVVAGSWALHRLLTSENAEVAWLPGDLDVLVRGRGEAKRATEQTKAYWSSLGYKVDACVSEDNSYAQPGMLGHDGLEDDTTLPAGWNVETLQGCIRHWLDVHGAEPAYAPLLHQLELAPDRLPAEPVVCSWLVEAMGAGGEHVTTKIVVTSPKPHGTAHKINIIAYAKVIPSSRPSVPPVTDATLVEARQGRAPIESVVDSFDILQCAVWCRMNSDLNGYRFGGAGEAAIKSGLGLGSMPPLELTPCVFAKATNIIEGVVRHDGVPGSHMFIYDQEGVKVLIDFQMRRIVKYLHRGFRFSA